ncbi:YeeE/YedE family protein [Sediminicurvatus halobius]|nr:YeeE/YedE family protein [Spiribacter halobius]UEX78411.1 YeeE/YedE family protein [Spiribacter halobius]
MAPFDPVSALAGGVLIGLASLLLLGGLGRIAGISGILGGALGRPDADTPWRLAFLLGLPAGFVLWAWLRGELPEVHLQTGWPGMLVAGAIVGFGTRLGSGCTSGHGVCGLARLSPRSLVATVIFMLTAAATVFLIRHVIGEGA